MLQRYSPSVFDRLFDDGGGALSGTRQLLSVDELKDCVARDLEALLNSRRGLAEDRLKAFPLAARSVASYGMDDFVSLSLLSPTDRLFICRSIERAITDHEPRLRNVRVSLVGGASSLQRLHFAIEAWLVLRPDEEPVHFDAMLQTLTQQYSVQPDARRPAGPIAA